MDAPLWGDTGGHTGTAPTTLRNIFPHNPTQTKEPFTCNPPKQHQPPLPVSTKPRGVPLPHRGYTFDSAGLASATQPTLGNNASEKATPLGVVLFPPHCFLMSSTHTSGAEMHRALPPPLLKIKKCVYVMIWAPPWMTSFILKQVILWVSRG